MKGMPSMFAKKYLSIIYVSMYLSNLVILSEKEKAKEESRLWTGGSSAAEWLRAYCQWPAPELFTCRMTPICAMKVCTMIFKAPSAMDCIVSPKFTCWNLKSNVTVWREGLYKVVKVKRGHGRALILEDWGPYKGKETSNIPLSLFLFLFLSLFKEKKGHVRNSERLPFKSQGKASRDPGLVATLILDFLTLKLWEINFYCLSAPAYGFCVAAWAKTTSGSEVFKVATKCGDRTFVTLCLILTVLVPQHEDLPSGVGVGPGETVSKQGRTPLWIALSSSSPPNTLLSLTVKTKALGK